MNMAATWKMNCCEETEGRKSSEKALVIPVEYILKSVLETFLAVQWLRLCIPVQGVQV